MKKENMRIKENIRLIDQISAINDIVDYYFIDNKYVPYYADIARVEAIVNNFIEGVTFDEDEYIYDCVMNDKELSELVHRFYFNDSKSDVAKKKNRENKKYLDIMAYIAVNVNEIVEVRKQELIHCTSEKRNFLNGLTEFIVDIDSSISNFANLDLTKLTPDVVETATKIMNQLKDKEITPDLVSDVIKNAIDFKVPETEIYEGQRKQIWNLQNLLKEERDKNNELEKKIVKFEARDAISEE